MRGQFEFTPGKPVGQPEEIWHVDESYYAGFQERIDMGLVEARRRKLAIVSIARNAMPHLKNTLRLVDELSKLWRDCVYYVFENDSTDETPQVLDEFAERPWVTVEHDTLGGEDTRGFQPDRTVRLAKCRTRCQEWVRNHAADADYVMVLDTDAHGGWSVYGVVNSLAWICEMRGMVTMSREVGGMASQSLFIRDEGGGRYGIAQYDAWAARLNFWDDRREHAWFHALLLPVGTPPVPMNSAFGGLCLYRKEAYLAGKYEGGDCEHVFLHRSMQRAGYQLFLNPSSRYVAILP